MSEEQDYTTAAERHHQIMMELNKGCNRLVFFIGFVLILIAGTVIFFIFKYDPFWKYP